MKIPSYSFEQLTGKTPLADLFTWGDNHSYNIGEKHSHKFNEVMIFEQGSGVHLMNNTEYEIQDFQIHILPANYIHQLDRGKLSNGFTIAFTDEFINQLQKFENKIDYLFFVNKPFIVQLNKMEHQSLKIYFDDIYLNKNANTSLFLNVISVILIKIFALGIEKNCCTLKINEFGSEFLKIFNKNFLQQHQLEYYAQAMNVCENTFAVNIKKTFQKTFSELKNEKLINHSKYLLLETKMSISEISDNLFFHDTAHFCHTFKKSTGTTPKQFRISGIIQ